MSERTENPEIEEELPARPRSRLLAPLPIALIAVLIAALGFLGGVLVQKSSGGSSSAALPGGGELPSFLSAAGGAEGESGGLPTGVPGGSGGNSITGTVTGVKSHTIYVKEAEGNTVAVKAEDGSTVTRDSKVSVKGVHPGDTVVIEGSKKGSTVKASSIAATEAGVGAGAPSVESLFGE